MHVHGPTVHGGIMEGERSIMEGAFPLLNIGIMVVEVPFMELPYSANLNGILGIHGSSNFHNMERPWNFHNERCISFFHLGLAWSV